MKKNWITYKMYTLPYLRAGFKRKKSTDWYITNRQPPPEEENSEPTHKRNSEIHISQLAWRREDYVLT